MGGLSVYPSISTPHITRRDVPTLERRLQIVGSHTILIQSTIQKTMIIWIQTQLCKSFEMLLNLLRNFFGGAINQHSLLVLREPWFWKNLVGGNTVKVTLIQCLN